MYNDRLLCCLFVSASLCNLEPFLVEEGSDDMFIVSEEQGTESSSKFFFLDK